MTESISPKGRYGVYVPYALLLSDFIVLNVVILVVALLFNKGVPAVDLRTIIVLANAAYLCVSRISLRMRRRRTIQMEDVVATALKVVGPQALIFFALVAFLGVGGVRWDVYLEMFVGIALMLPVSWIVTRIALKILRRRGRNYVNVVIVGDNTSSRRLAAELEMDSAYGYVVHGFFEHPGENLDGKRHDRVLGTIDDLADYLEVNQVDEIYYTHTSFDNGSFTHVVNLADENIIPFYYIPQIPRYVARSFQLTTIGTVPVLRAHSNPLENPVNRIVKRGFDIVFSSLFLLVSPIVFIPIAVAIKISSPGPILFKQRRTGYKGNEFTCLKFRTMRVNAKADTAQATADDPRKTRVGDFLRRTSLDELPQFVNVLVGDMSVVGPRPHMVKHTRDYSRLIDRYMLRHMVKPGITGWAQVLGYRGATTELWQMEKRVERDVWYIEHWSPMLDIKIIVRTVFNAVKGEDNAY